MFKAENESIKFSRHTLSVFYLFVACELKKIYVPYTWCKLLAVQIKFL